eukprot:197829-Rhodomonas_salina.1
MQLGGRVQLRDATGAVDIEAERAIQLVAIDTKHAVAGQVDVVVRQLIEEREQGGFFAVACHTRIDATRIPALHDVDGHQIFDLEGVASGVSAVAHEVARVAREHQ